MPFQTIISNTAEHFIVTLKDVTNNTFAEIYAYGALLNKFCAVNNQEPLNVIEGFLSPAEATEKVTNFF